MGEREGGWGREREGGGEREEGGEREREREGGVCVCWGGGEDQPDGHLPQISIPLISRLGSGPTLSVASH